MPIKSYLAHPYNGKKEELAYALAAIEYCEIIPAKNKEVLILITDTNSEEEEDHLQSSLQKIDSLKLLAMVSGFNSPSKN
ncbi:hypothetical protein KH5_13110 [Urechidicola sp. KH5]